MTCVFAVLPPGAAAQAKADIRGVDFRNYTYRTGPAGESIRVVNGEFLREDEDDRLYFRVVDVAYGDLTGDGADEAVVTTLENTGGTGQFTDGLVFTMRGGSPVLLADLGVGDRADGGIHDVRVESGRLVVERYGQENGGSCCPTYVERAIFVLRGKELVRAGKSERLSYQLYPDEARGRQRVRFVRGGSGAVLSGATNTGERFVVGARGGQSMQLRFDSRDARAAATAAAPDGRVLARLGPGESWTGPLPAAGDYTLTIASATGKDSTEAYYTLEVEIR